MGVAKIVVHFEFMNETETEPAVSISFSANGMRSVGISDFLKAARRDRWERGNLFRSSGPLSTIWRNEFRAPKNLRCAHAKLRG